MVGADSKSTLNSFAQRHLKRPISKTDIVYSVAKFGEQYQATVSLNCMDGVQFAGEVANSQKEAEHNAAQIALANFGTDVAAMMDQRLQGKKRKASDAMLPDGAAAPHGPVHESARTSLNTMLMRYMRRPLAQGDLVYSTVQTALGFQCTVTMPCLTGEYEGLGWAGEVAGKKKEAEENAAFQAFEALSADPAFAETATKTVKKGKSGKGKEKGKGKGGWDFPPEMMAMMEAMMGKAEGKGMKGKASMMLDMMKGKAKGKGKGMKGPKPRERISEAPLSGTVAEWKGKYGWIQPMEVIEHEAVQRNNGKIFLHIKDWPSDIGEPIEGASVCFQLYQDPSGLGAEEVLLV
mmetsp:Transcript_84253/g.235969  ORF Transcript_84253/g.235969 Transcript_84253/m.235969 type:complete len:349 (-) Transcript_84253:57-1103(-)